MYLFTILMHVHTHAHVVCVTAITNTFCALPAIRPYAETFVIFLIISNELQS